MLKSCTYCGRIHDRSFICPQKKQALAKRQAKKKDTASDIFHSSYKWTKMSKHIRERDHYLCQACLHGLDGEGKRYTTAALEVHHIVSLNTDYDKRLDEDNLITLCHECHEKAEQGIVKAKELIKLAAEQH